MRKVLQSIKDFFKIEPRRYRCGLTYQFFYGWAYCIQKEDFVGNYRNIFKTDDKQLWAKKIKRLEKDGIKFED